MHKISKIMALVVFTSVLLSGCYSTKCNNKPATQYSPPAPYAATAK
jgi:outer membrane murein-binding lipoprotein Lpp